FGARITPILLYAHRRPGRRTSSRPSRGAALTKRPQVVGIPSTFVPFPESMPKSNFLLEQFWGRAARASRHSERSFEAPVSLHSAIGDLAVCLPFPALFRGLRVRVRAVADARAKYWMPSAMPSAESHGGIQHAS